MKINAISILILVGIVVFAIMACFSISLVATPLSRSNQPDSNGAAATVQAVATETMYVMTQNASASIPATATSIPETSTPIRSANTDVPTVVSYCDWAIFIKDVTIPDETQVSAGEVFTKVWRLQNGGNCTWSPDYMLVFSNGDPMGSTTQIRLPGYVAPGQTVDVSVTLTAPASTGYYKGYWMLRNPSGSFFGAGSKADEAFHVEIRTIAESQYGKITGNLSYPSEFIPAMRVAAFSLTNGKAYFLDTANGQGVYSINVPPGTYYVVSYLYQGVPGNTGQVDSYTLGGGPFAGGYTNMVPCGLAAGCDDHALLAVVVEAGQTVTVNPGDWYAPEGAFPSIPNP
jgi:hypothetical protein